MTRTVWQPMTVDERDEALVAETEILVLTPAEAVEVVGDVPVLTIEEWGKQLGIANQRWADERQWCHHAIAGERPAMCPMFANDEDTPSGFCQLNGYSDPTERTLCVFDEPPDAEIWRKVAYWRRQREEVEPCDDY
ncbi:MAG: hypothetical protein FJZ90_12180 [Chloroflexi bacterium]|nr:hypothetical protein [Chloroflexota bacterium]